MNLRSDDFRRFCLSLWKCAKRRERKREGGGREGKKKKEKKERKEKNEGQGRRKEKSGVGSLFGISRVIG